MNESMFANLIDDIDGMMSRDPAARSRLEVFLCYPGLHAVLLHRLARWMWVRNWRIFARILSQLGRFLTGIEIHPGATIGKRLFIDHAMGVVIGETAEIGDDVTLYHDVTLGGVSPSVNSDSQRQQKRHPTLKNDVIVGSGAQILGPIIVGAGARVGANAVVTKDVSECVTVVGVPARVVVSRAKTKDSVFSPYGIPMDDVMDPVARAIEELVDQVSSLKARIDEMENRSNAFVDERPEAEIGLVDESIPSSKTKT